MANDVQGLRFKISENDAYVLQATLVNYGYEYLGKQVLYDFVPDTKDFSCKKNGITLKVQSVIDEKKHIYLSLKKKGTDIDLKTEFGNPDLEVLNRINQILLIDVNIRLSGRVLALNNLIEIMQMLKDLGFIEERINYGKTVKSYINNISDINFITLEKDYGNFVEVICDNEVDLAERKRALGLNDDNIVTSSYLQIVNEARQKAFLENDKKKRLSTKSVLEEVKEAAVINKEVEVTEKPPVKNTNSKRLSKAGKKIVDYRAPSEIIYDFVAEAEKQGKIISYIELRQAVFKETNNAEFLNDDRNCKMRYQISRLDAARRNCVKDYIDKCAKIYFSNIVKR